MLELENKNIIYDLSNREELEEFIKKSHERQEAQESRLEFDGLIASTWGDTTAVSYILKQQELESDGYRK